MMRPRNPSKLFAFVVVASLLGLFVIFRATRQELFHPSSDDFSKVKDGMTQSEVEAILGPPHKVITSESSEKNSSGLTILSRRISFTTGQRTKKAGSTYTVCT
jgi:hypothetical protein